MFGCPCCGMYTMPSLADYCICPLCGWEDDGTPDGTYSDCNAGTMEDYRKKLER